MSTIFIEIPNVLIIIGRDGALQMNEFSKGQVLAEIVNESKDKLWRTICRFHTNK